MIYKIKNVKIVDSSKDVAKEFAEYIKYIYGDICDIDYAADEEAKFTMYVPGELKREEFESDVQEFCDEHECSFELVNQTPEAPSAQYFSENMKLMYPSVKSYEVLAKDPRKLEAAKEIFKEQWEADFDENSEDDREDIVLLWNEHMEEQREWKPVELKLHFKKEEEAEVVEDEMTDIYRLDAKLVNIDDPKNIKEQHEGVEFGTKEELKEKVKELNSVWNVRNDNYLWKFTARKVAVEDR